MTGQYANPIVSPPQVAIVGAGRIREKVVPYDGAATIRRILPLSLPFDHRAATGGEASRFLGALVEAWQDTGGSGRPVVAGLLFRVVANRRVGDNTKARQMPEPLTLPY